MGRRSLPLLLQSNEESECMERLESLTYDHVKENEDRPVGITDISQDYYTSLEKAFASDTSVNPTREPKVPPRLKEIRPNMAHESDCVSAAFFTESPSNCLSNKCHKHN